MACCGPPYDSATTALADYGFAPGGYMTRCGDCKKLHASDKRAWRCIDCAKLKSSERLRR